MSGPSGPEGTVTFLFTDVEGSTRMWEAHPEAMRGAIERHDQIVRAAIAAHGGYIFSTAGDSFGASFDRADAATAAALDAQHDLGGAPWPRETPIRVRMGLHTGESHERDGNYFGPAVNRAARIMSAAHGTQILSSDVTVSISQIESATDLGERRLRDLSRPVRLFRIDRPGLPSVDLPPRTLDATPGNLPLQATNILGRSELAEQLATMILTDRLVTLTGVGGVGKTRLALHVAGELAPAFDDGTWLIELMNVRDPSRVPDAIAAELGLHGQTDQDDALQLTLELARWRALLVLDNAEHVVTGVARTVEILLQRCPNLRILVTSREGIAVAGERLVAVPPLALAAEPGQLADAELLFEERSRAATAEFAITAHNIEAVRRLCARLDGVPLALELAAARTRMLSPAEIADHLDQRFRLLTGGARTAVDRHRTLRASLDWSYELLPPTAQLVFRRLGVFAGSFTLDAAQALLAEEVDRFDVLDAMTTLVDQSLVTTAVSSESSRYRLMETLRHYSLDRSGEDGDLRRIRARHAAVFLDRARWIGGRYFTSSQPDVHRTAVGDADNYVAAIEFALEHHDLDTALGTAAGLAPMHLCGHLSGTLARQAMEADGATEHPLWPIVASGPAYDEWITSGGGPPPEVLSAGSRAPLRPVTTKIIETYTPWYDGDAEVSVGSAQLWVAEAEARGDDHDVAYALAVLAHLQFIAGQDCREAAAQSLAVAEHVGAPSLLSFAHQVVALSLRRSDGAGAIAHLNTSLDLARSVDADVAIGISASHLAGLASDRQSAVAVLVALRPHLTISAVTEPGALRGFNLWLGAALALVRVGEQIVSATVMGWVDRRRSGLSWGSSADDRVQLEVELTALLASDTLEEHRRRGATLGAAALAQLVQEAIERVAKLTA